MTEFTTSGYSTRMTATESTQEKRKRVQAMVSSEKHRKIKAAAATAGLTIEQWMERAADEQLARESRARFEAVR